MLSAHVGVRWIQSVIRKEKKRYFKNVDESSVHVNPDFE
jgi:hypothetical protein